MKSDNKKIIEAFLFGEMTAKERSEFEDRFAADADLFEEIKAFENDLIEKYVRGWMDPDSRARFENSFLTTKKRRERIEFARNLVANLDERRESVGDDLIVNAPGFSFWEKTRGWFLILKHGFALAAVLLISILGGWLIYRNFDNDIPESVQNRTDSSEEQAPSSPGSLPVPEVTQPAKIEEPPEKNADHTQEHDEVPVEASPTPLQTPVSKPPPNPVLALFSGTQRSEGKNQVLLLTDKAVSVKFILNLENRDYSVYLAELTDADGKVLHRQNKLKAERSAINFIVPAEKLKTGDYMIKLSGYNAAGETESAADFQFRVKK